MASPEVGRPLTSPVSPRPAAAAVTAAASAAASAPVSRKVVTFGAAAAATNSPGAAHQPASRQRSRSGHHHHHQHQKGGGRGGDENDKKTSSSFPYPSSNQSCRRAAFRQESRPLRKRSYSFSEGTDYFQFFSRLFLSVFHTVEVKKVFI